MDTTTGSAATSVRMASTGRRVLDTNSTREMSGTHSSIPQGSRSNIRYNYSAEPTEDENPFVVPSDEQIFKSREREKMSRIQSRQEQKHLKIWEKNAPKTKGMLRQLKAEAEPELDEETREKIKRTQNLVAAATAAMSSSKRKQKESMTKFIDKKREMFLLQMSLDTKREEIQKLEHKAQMKEEALKKSELMLEEDAIRFDAFLKENDRMAHSAMKRAEEESRLKQQKVQEIKRLKYQIQALKGENAKNEDLLREWESYRAFLDELTPDDWKRQQLEIRAQKAEQKRIERYEADLTNWETTREGYRETLEQEEAAARKRALAMGRRPPTSNIEAKLDSIMPPKPCLDDYNAQEDGNDEDFPMYFTHPEQLLDVFTGMEEENLFLIQNNQEIEQQLEELKQQYMDTKKAMEQQTEVLDGNMGSLRDKISGEEAKVTKLQRRIQTSHAQDAQGQLLSQLGRRIKEVYEKCGGDLSSNPDRISMLTKLEAKLEELLAALDKMPREYVAAKEREVEAERRKRVRAERLEEQQQALAQRLQKSLARAQAPVKKRSGKPVMSRSAPIRKKKEKAKMDAELAQELEDMKFFI